VEDVKIYTTVNRNENGEISEIYITTDREGTLIMGLLNSLSKTISVMLQYHIPPQNISKMLRGQKYEPYGFVTRHPYIKYCTSVSDLISKIIDIEIGDYSRLQVKPEGDMLTGRQPDIRKPQAGKPAPAAAGSAAQAFSAPAAAPMVSAAPAVSGTPLTPLATDTPAASAVSDALADTAMPGDPAPKHNGVVNPAFPNLPEREYATGYQSEPSIDGVLFNNEPENGYVHESARHAALTGEKLYDGSICPTCSSSRMVRNGTCKVCLDCGTTTGCS